MEKQVSMETALSAGWQALVANLALIGALIVWGLLVHVPSFVIEGIKIGVVGFNSENTSSNTGLMFLFAGLGLGVWAWQVFAETWLRVGWTKIVLKSIQGESWQFGELFSNMHLWWNFFASTFLYSLMVGTGLIFLIAPGVFLGISFGFYRFFVVNEGMGPIKALEASWELTNGCRLQLCLLGLVIGFVNLAGLLCLIVGVIPASIVGELAWANAYTQLRGRPGQR